MEDFDRLIARRSTLEEEMRPLLAALRPLQEEWEQIQKQIHDQLVPGSHWLSEPLRWDLITGRLKQVLKRCEIHDQPLRTYGDVVQYSAAEYKTFAYFTDVQIAALVEHLKSLGLRLRP